MTTTVGILTLHIHLAGCVSLKEKRGRIRPLLTRIRREFNISAAEVDHLDVWQDALIACALVSNERPHIEKSLQKVVGWVEKNWPDVSVVDDQIEVI